MDKLTAIKIKYDDGTYSDEIPVSVLSENVEWDSTHTLVDVLGSIDVDVTGTIQDQISQLFNEKVSNTQLNTYVANQLNEDVTEWLNDNVNPVGSAVIVDNSLTVSGAAADAKITGDIILNVEKDLYNFFSRQLLKQKNWIENELYNQNNTTIWSNMPDWKRYPMIKLYAGNVYTIMKISTTFTNIKDSSGVTRIDHLDYFSGNGSLGTLTISEDCELYISTQKTNVSPMLIIGEVSEEYIEGYYNEDIIKNISKMSNIDSKIQLSLNITDSFTKTEGKYIIASNGTVGSMNGFIAILDYIEIPSALSKMYIKKTFHYGGDGIAFYDKDLNYISGYSDTTNEGSFIWLDIPSNAKYFRLSAYIATNSTMEVYIGNINNVINNAINTSIDNAIKTAIDFDTISQQEVHNKILASITDINLNGNATYDSNTKQIIQRRTIRGNGWWLLPIKNWNTEQNIVNIQLTVDEIGEVEIKPYLFGKKPDGSNCWNLLTAINQIGTYNYNIDLNYYVVYRDLDLTQDINFGCANGNGSDGTWPTEDHPFYAVYSNIFVEDLTTKLDTDKTFGENLNDIIDNIDINKTNITTLESTIKTETIKIAPNGKKFIIQVQNDGTTIAVPVLPSNITYIGNSLLFGFGTFGMAATRSTEDYYYYINSYLQEQGNTLTTNKVYGSTYEGSTTTSEAENWLNNTLIPALDVNKELVLIQLSDNVNTDEKRSYFQSEGAEKLVATIRQYAPKARVVWMAAWYANTNNITAIVNACKKYGASFINLRDLPSIEGNTSYVGAIYYDDDGNEHEITSTGVASHPSSQGMRAIADRVIETLFEV